MPYVIEPAAGLTRAMLAFLLDAYDEDEAPNAKGGVEKRTVMRFDPRLAPVKVAVLPLSRNADLSPKARDLAAALRKQLERRVRRRRRDRPPLPPAGRDRHAVLRHRRLRHPRRQGGDGAGARHDGAGAGRAGPGAALPGRAPPRLLTGRPADVTACRPAAGYRRGTYSPCRTRVSTGATEEGGARAGDGFVGRAVELGRLAEACRARPGRPRPGGGLSGARPGSARPGSGRARRGARPAAGPAGGLGPVLDRRRRAGAVAVASRCWPSCAAPAAAAARSTTTPDRPSVDPERFARFVAVGERLAAACGRDPGAYLVLDDLHARRAGRAAAHPVPRPAAAAGRRCCSSSPPGDGAGGARDARPARRGGHSLRAARLRPRRHPRLPRRAVLGGVDPALARAAHRVTGGNPLLLQRLVALGPRSTAAGAARTGCATWSASRSAGSRPRPGLLVATAAVLGPAPVGGADRGGRRPAGRGGARRGARPRAGLVASTGPGPARVHPRPGPGRR